MVTATENTWLEGDWSETRQDIPNWRPALLLNMPVQVLGVFHKLRRWFLVIRLISEAVSLIASACSVVLLGTRTICGRIGAPERDLMLT